MQSLYKQNNKLKVKNTHSDCDCSKCKAKKSGTTDKSLDCGYDYVKKSRNDTCNGNNEPSAISEGKIVTLHYSSGRDSPFNGRFIAQGNISSDAFDAGLVVSCEGFVQRLDVRLSGPVPTPLQYVLFKNGQSTGVLANIQSGDRAHIVTNIPVSRGDYISVQFLGGIPGTPLDIRSQVAVTIVCQ